MKNHSRRKNVDDKVREHLKYCCENNIFKFSAYVKEYRKAHRKNKGVSHKAYRKSVLKSIAVNDLKVFAIICGFKIFDNDFGVYVKLLNSFMEFVADPVKTTFLVFMPRGTWKSVLIQSCGMLWIYINSMHKNGEAHAIPMIHGDEGKSEMNLSLLKTYAKKEILQYLFPEYLQIEIDNASELKFVDEISTIKRKEPHFMSMSVNSDPEGEHFGFFAIDDWVTFKNTAKIESNNKNKSKYRSLYSLEDHVNHPKYAVVGTRHWTDDVYSELLSESNSEFVQVFEIPAAKYVDLDREDNIFYFRQLPRKKLKRYKIAFENEPHKFLSQYFNIPKDRSERLQLASDLPEFNKPDDKDVEIRFLLCDPAVSKKNKFSRLIIHVVYITTGRNIYVVDTFSSVGTTPNEFKDQMINMALAHRVDYAIIEQIAAQEYMRLDILEEMERRIKAGKMQARQRFIVLGHAHRENKETHFMNFLQPLFARKQVFINPLSKELISQCNRESELNDEVDCLSFMIELRKQLGFDFTNSNITEEILTNEEYYKKDLKRRSKYGMLRSRWL